MTTDSQERTPRQGTPSTGAGAPMSAQQAVQLRQLAHDAYEIEAFNPNLTQAEAERRIATLRAKLPLQGEPPHTQ